MTGFPTMNVMIRTYLDWNAGAPLEPRVLEAMLPWLRQRHGNPSSLHAEGREARRAVEDAREEVAALIGAEPAEIIFTSGATEANVLALRSVPVGGHLAVSAVEHPSVIDTAAAMQDQGSRVTLLPVDAAGRLRLDELERLLATSQTDLVAVMAANNEVGTLQPWRDAAALAERHGARFHVDAVQAAGRVPFDVGNLYRATASLSAHKLGGPKGAGALWARRETRLLPLLSGGGQERGRRAGTENVPAIVGFGTACRFAREEGGRRATLLRGFETRFLAVLRDRIPQAVLHGPPDPGARLPGTLGIRIPGVRGELMLVGLDLKGVSVSLGSACSSGAARPSHVLEAMGLGKTENLESFRVSLGWIHRPEELDEAARSISEVAQGAARG